MNFSTPGLAPPGELGPQSCYKTIARVKANNVCSGHFSARDHSLGAWAQKLSFLADFSRKWQVRSASHCIALAETVFAVFIMNEQWGSSETCNSTLRQPISTKFSHNVQMWTKSRKIRASPNLGVKGGSHPQKFFFREYVIFEWAFAKTYL